MFKLMIADDNPYVLNELSDAIDWEEFDLCLSGAFLNGKELLSAAREDLPDIVLTDISMPILDGIALATELQTISPRTRIVFLSSYSDFEYAQKAVQLRIAGYLLKPFDPGQLASLIRNIVKELCDDRLQQFEKTRQLQQAEAYRTLAIEHCMSKLLFHPQEYAVIRWQLEELNFSLEQTVWLRVAHVLLDSVPERTYAECGNLIRSLLQTRQESDYDLILLSYKPAEFSVLIVSRDPDLETDNLLSQLHIDIETAVGVSSTIGFSSSAESFDVISELAAQAAAAAMQHPFTKNAVIGYDDIQTENSKLSGKHTLSSISGYVQNMQEYIHANYMMPITTNDVSSSVYLSSSYANQCFSTACNCTIFDYITQCRIEQAKKLLAETDKKVSSIAELVGYNGKTSFYLAFKRNVGVSPTEYRCMYNSSGG